MKVFLLALFLLFESASLAIGQEDPLGQNFLFDESDIIIHSEEADNGETVNKAKSETELNDAVNKAKNRRVEIVVLKNKHKELSKKNMQEILKEVKLQRQKKSQYIKPPSEAIEGLVGNDKELLRNVIDLSNQYNNENERIKSLTDENYLHDGKKPDFLEN